MFKKKYKVRVNFFLKSGNSFKFRFEEFSNSSTSSEVTDIKWKGAEGAFDIMISQIEALTIEKL